MRLFVAVDLPREVRGEIAEVIETLRPSAPDAKWVPAENLHLTLVFLGEVHDERLGEIEGALRMVLVTSLAVPTSLAEAGAFPRPKRARVLWIGLSDETGALAALAESCIGAMESVGFAREARAWTPHLTIARFRVPGDASRIGPATVRPMSFEVGEVTIFRSRLARPAPRYEAVTRVPLGRGPSGSARPAGT